MEQWRDDKSSHEAVDRPTRKNCMLSVAKLLDKARQSTGLDDLGNESYCEGLAVAVRAANTESRLNDRGFAMLESKLVMLLSNRLRVEHWYALHPEIDEQQIVAPLIGLSLPRTGSTALGCNLAEDPAMRSLLMWEASAPCPPPEKISYCTDPRIAELDRRMVRSDELYPRLKTMLPHSATAIAEDLNLLGLDFKWQSMLPSARVPSYADWLLHEADVVPAYRYMKRALKLLQWRCPGRRWQLKSPCHLPFIEALNEVFPDAKFWMIHRDIASVLPSVVDIYHELLRPVMDEVDGQYIIDVTTNYWTIGLQRTMAFRDQGHEERFIDLQFAEFQQDPECCIERVYRFLGDELTDDTRGAMADWRRTSAIGAHGKHVYDTIAASLDLEAIRGHFRFYTDRFVA